MPHHKQEQNPQLPQISATATIWAFATGMLAICIPIVAITQSGVILPLAVVLGASVSTAVVWRNPIHQNDSMVNLNHNLKELTGRVEDLETICSSDNFNASKQFKQIDSEN